MMIRMPKGDIRLARFLVKNPNGVTADTDFSEILFSVKKPNDRQYRFQKSLSEGGIIKLESGDYQVKIEPEDTENMLCGKYKFSIQLIFADIIKQKFSGEFILLDE